MEKLDSKTIENMDTSIADENIINSLTGDIHKLEEQILPQLDELGKKIPELYKGYANLVRTTVTESVRAGA